LRECCSHPTKALVVKKEIGSFFNHLLSLQEQ
jgi:hypothetical protein